MKKLISVCICLWCLSLFAVIPSEMNPMGLSNRMLTFHVVENSKEIFLTNSILRLYCYANFDNVLSYTNVWSTIDASSNIVLSYVSNNSSDANHLKLMIFGDNDLYYIYRDDSPPIDYGFMIFLLDNSGSMDPADYYKVVGYVKNYILELSSTYKNIVCKFFSFDDILNVTETYKITDVLNCNSIKFSSATAAYGKYSNFFICIILDNGLVYYYSPFNDNRLLHTSSHVATEDDIYMKVADLKNYVFVIGDIILISSEEVEETVYLRSKDSSLYKMISKITQPTITVLDKTRKIKHIFWSANEVSNRKWSYVVDSAIREVNETKYNLPCIYFTALSNNNVFKYNTITNIDELFYNSILMTKVKCRYSESINTTLNSLSNILNDIDIPFSLLYDNTSSITSERKIIVLTDEADSLTNLRKNLLSVYGEDLVMTLTADNSKWNITCQLVTDIITVICHYYDTDKNSWQIYSIEPHKKRETITLPTFNGLNVKWYKSVYINASNYIGNSGNTYNLSISNVHLYKEK